MNAKKIVYVFDSSRPIKQQIRSLKKQQNVFGQMHLASFGKTRIKGFGKIHDLSSKEGTDNIKQIIDSAFQ
jgi:hypothetical protein